MKLNGKTEEESYLKIEMKSERMERNWSRKERWENRTCSSQKLIDFVPFFTESTQSIERRDIDFIFFSFFWQNLYKLSNRNEKRTAKKRDDIRRDECFVFQRIEKWKSRVIFSIWNQDYFKYIKYEAWYSKNFAIFAIYFKIVIKYEFGIFYPLQNIRFPS